MNYKLLLLFILNFITFEKLFTSDYYSIYDESRNIGKFYIVREDFVNYKNNSLYLKLKQSTSNDELNEIIRIILKNNKINDFNISRMNRPFEVYSDQFLRINNLSKIINIKFISTTSSWLISKILQESGEFCYVIPERIYKFSSINSNDPLNDKVDYLDSLQVNEIWKMVKGDSTVSIGIVDTGVMVDHEDLKNSIKKNTLEIPNDGKDNDNNGFIDDYLGWDFVGDINAIELLNEELKPDNNVTPTKSNNSHGTHVAGITSAITNNNIGISSLGYNLSYIPVKVSPDDLSNLNYVVKPFEGVLYALNRGADVINCSWLGDDFDPLAQDIVNEVVARGSILVCAAGNFSLDNYDHPFITPASLKNVISVGATYKDNVVTDFSHFGWNVDLFAPGSRIYSSIMGNNYGNMSGTSMASPLIASVVGLIKKLHPDWSFKQIELQLRANVSAIPNDKVSDTTKYWGALDALKTLQSNKIAGMSNPGLTIDDYFIEKNKLIQERNIDYNLNLKVSNLLSSTKSITIELIPLANFIYLSSKTLNIEKLDNNEFKTMNINIKLLDNTPYFEGNIPILVIIKAENYKNLEIIEIPFKIETSTKFLAAQYFNHYLDNYWVNAKSPSKYSLWAIGTNFFNDKGIVFSFGKNQDPLFVTKKPTAIFPFNDSKAIIGFEPQNKNENSELQMTENAGFSFKTIDKPFAAIYDIHFYNSQNGIVVGSNNSSYLGIKTSKDGGKSWSFSPLVVAEQDESIMKYAVKKLKSIILTNKNNIYYSDSLGLNWEKVGKIVSNNSLQSVIISDNKSIVGISSTNDTTKVFYSLDLGKSWFQNQIKIAGKFVKSFFLEDTDIIYCLFDDGQIIYSDNFFKSYKYILNKDSRFGKLDYGTEYLDSCGIRFWQLNYNLYFSDIEDVNPNSLGELEIAGRNQILFDTLEINKSSDSEILFATNSGKKVILIKEHSFSNNSNGSFKLNKKYPNLILPCQLYDAKVNFNPKSAGWHYDTLSITNDNNIIQYYLSGFCYDPTSVYENYTPDFNITPNPASDYLTINIRTSNIIEPSEELNMEIFDVVGVKIQTISVEKKHFSTLQKIDVSNLTTGVYFLKIGPKVEKFIKY